MFKKLMKAGSTSRDIILASSAIGLLTAVCFLCDAYYAFAQMWIQWGGCGPYPAKLFIGSEG